MDVIEKTKLGHFVKKTHDVWDPGRVTLNTKSGCDEISIYSIVVWTGHFVKITRVALSGP